MGLKLWKSYSILEASDALIFVYFSALQRFGEVGLCEMCARWFSHSLKIV